MIYKCMYVPGLMQRGHSGGDEWKQNSDLAGIARLTGSMMGQYLCVCVSNWHLTCDAASNRALIGAYILMSYEPNKRCVCVRLNMRYDGLVLILTSLQPFLIK